MVTGKIKQVLGRVGYLMLRDGSLQVKSGAVPSLDTEEV